jgi:hypothetical protein
MQRIVKSTSSALEPLLVSYPALTRFCIPPIRSESRFPNGETSRTTAAIE